MDLQALKLLAFGSGPSVRRSDLKVPLLPPQHTLNLPPHLFIADYRSIFPRKLSDPTTIGDPFCFKGELLVRREPQLLIFSTFIFAL